jgi:lipopolysaccharide export system permease protein
MPIIAIGSLILFVRIAKLTEVTHMNASEMLLMYGYSLPMMLFYTLPITFFTALILTLNKLSNDYESVVLFSFGISPIRILTLFLPLILLLSITLLVLSLVLMPITKQLTKSFINYKSINAVVNIEASKFGQKFGNWMVFLESRDKNSSLNNVVLYNNSNSKEEQFLIAKKGNFFNENGTPGIILNSGEAYRIYKNKVNQINYKEMKMYHNVKVKPFSYQNIPEYWSYAKKNPKRMKNLILSIAISIFPFSTLFWAFAFGILHPRYDKNYGYITILAVTASYYGAISTLAKSSFVGTSLFIILFTSLGAILFYNKVQRRF